MALAWAWAWAPSEVGWNGVYKCGRENQATLPPPPRPQRPQRRCYEADTPSSPHIYYHALRALVRPVDWCGPAGKLRTTLSPQEICLSRRPPRISLLQGVSILPFVPFNPSSPVSFRIWNPRVPPPLSIRLRRAVRKARFLS
jgi:hypothetical protein